MTVLVTFASKYGSTAGIAERVAETLTLARVDTETRAIDDVEGVDGYRAVVLGSAVYFGSWLKAADAFVEENAGVLGDRPVWLFSSGPLPGAVLPEGQDADPTPKGIGDLAEAIHARDHRVFDGALDPSKLTVRDRLIRALPAGRPLLPEVDGRNWTDIQAWAKDIARQLTH
jgi:menaquinone-dependent protoporphyrinogen oxidase